MVNFRERSELKAERDLARIKPLFKQKAVKMSIAASVASAYYEFVGLDRKMAIVTNTGDQARVRKTGEAQGLRRPSLLIKYEKDVLLAFRVVYDATVGFQSARSNSYAESWQGSWWMWLFSIPYRENGLSGTRGLWKHVLYGENVLCGTKSISKKNHSK